MYTGYNNSQEEAQMTQHETALWLDGLSEEDINALLPKLPTATRDVIKLRYANRLHWDGIANRLRFCPARAKSLHQSALTIIQAKELYK